MISLFMFGTKILFLKECTPKTLNSTAELADQYKDATDLTAIQVLKLVRVKPCKKPLESNVKSERTELKDENKFVPRNKQECYECHKHGHIAPECRLKYVMNSVAQKILEKRQPTCIVSTIPNYSFVDSTVSRSLTTLTSSCKKV